MPEDFTDLFPEDNHTANARTVEKIHNTMNTVIEMYEDITNGLN